MTQEDKIKAYLRNQLPPDEMAAFKAQIQSDAELQAKVKGISFLLSMQDAMEQEHLKTQMQHWSEELPSLEKKAPASYKRWPWVALGLILCVMAVWVATQQNPGPRQQNASPGRDTVPTKDAVKPDTAKTHVAPPIAVQRPSRESFYNTREEINAELQRMNQEEKMSGFSTSVIDNYLFRMDFKKAIAVAEKSREKSDETNIKLAFSYLQLKQYKEAIVVCAKVLENPNVFFFSQNNARWIKAQCHYELGDLTAAAKELEAIKNAKSPRGNPPGKLLLDKVSDLETLVNKNNI